MYSGANWAAIDTDFALCHCVMFCGSSNLYGHLLCLQGNCWVKFNIESSSTYWPLYINWSFYKIWIITPIMKSTWVISWLIITIRTAGLKNSNQPRTRSTWGGLVNQQQHKFGTKFVKWFFFYLINWDCFPAGYWINNDWLGWESLLPSF